jgi:hypothetical protein
MTRLERYLEKNAVSVEEACTTNSKYYRIGAAIVRYSDHISTDYPSFDIQIIKPTGSFSRLYTFGVSNSSKISHMNASQIIAYLPYASIHAELMGRAVTRKINRKPGEIVESRLLNNTQFEKIVYRLKGVFKESEINYLPTMVGMEFGVSSGICAKFKNFLRTTPMKYQEFINVYKMVIIDNEETATKENLKEALEKVRSLIVK